MSQSRVVPCPHCGQKNRIPAGRLEQHPSCGHCKKAIFAGKPVELTSGNFSRQVLESELPVLVDFWAPWCGPCKMMAPAFEQAAAALEPGVRLGKLNTEAVQDVAARFEIRSIPTLILFKNGKAVAQHSGAMMEKQIVDWVRHSLA